MKRKLPTGGERLRRPITALMLRTGGLIGAAMLGGLFVAACDSSVTDLGTAVAAPTRAPTKTAAERVSLFEPLDHSVVSQRSTAHESDLPGASIAAYGN